MRNPIIIFIWMLLAFSSILAGCNKDIDTEQPISSAMISQVNIPSSFDVYIGQSIIIEGIGFKFGDILTFSSSSNEFEINVTNITDGYCTITVPNNFVSNAYNVVLKRGNYFQILGSVTMNLKTIKNVPNKSGATIKGMVYCANNPISGVRVTDGINTTQTDQNGFYWLNSTKYHGYVYYTIPSGYLPYDNGSKTFPKFWAVLKSDKDVCEQHDFELKEVDNTNHTMLVAADLHLANRTITNDLSQFNNGFVNDVGEFVNASGNIPVYTMILGDLTWDHLWYANKYNLQNYKYTIESSFPTIVFNVMGNHDNDPYMAGDFNGEKAFKETLGPTYYSMNLGNVHYIILDNTVWINTNGAQGIIGNLNYSRHIDDMQMNWLKSDLNAITDKSTPIVIGFHCSSHSNYSTTFTIQKSYSSESTDELLDCLSGFTNVHFLSGHTHYNSNMDITSNIMEHNTASVCETWWWSGKLTDVSICKDGTPSGYGVYQINGPDINWYYKSIGKSKSKQFRTYDMNEVKKFFNSVEVQNELKKYPDRNGEGNDFVLVANNIVYINIWNYDPKWKVSVTEDGAELPVTRIYERDPLHSICYDYPRMVFDNYLNADWSSVKNSHMFKVEVRSSTSALQIKVTDRFGNEYEETMARPKSFDVTSD